MSQALTLARPYARAAFALARDNGAYAPWSNALAFAARVAADPQVSPASLVEVVVPQGDVDPLFQQFLSVLAENRRLAVLPEISGLFESLRAEEERTVRATITSASVLSEDEVAKLRASLVKRFGREVVVTTAVDPALIGGAVIDAGDVVIDGSLRSKLDRLGAALAN